MKGRTHTEVNENSGLRKIFGSNREEVRQDRKNVYNEEFHDFSPLQLFCWSSDQGR
jgi:hypothetical protein